MPTIYFFIYLSYVLLYPMLVPPPFFLLSTSDSNISPIIFFLVLSAYVSNNSSSTLFLVLSAPVSNTSLTTVLSCPLYSCIQYQSHQLISCPVRSCIHYQSHHLISCPVCFWIQSVLPSYFCPVCICIHYQFLHLISCPVFFCIQYQSHYVIYCPVFFCIHYQSHPIFCPVCYCTSIGRITLFIVLSASLSIPVPPQICFVLFASESNTSLTTLHLHPTHTHPLTFLLCWCLSHIVPPYYVLSRLFVHQIPVPAPDFMSWLLSYPSPPHVLPISCPFSFYIQEQSHHIFSCPVCFVSNTTPLTSFLVLGI